MMMVIVRASTWFDSRTALLNSSQGCRGYGDLHGDLHGYGYGVGIGMIFHPHRPMGILWGFLINLK